MKVSVIIPVSRDVETRRSVSNLQRQEGVDLEIILVHSVPHEEFDKWLEWELGIRFPIKQIDAIGVSNPHTLRTIGLTLARHELVHLLDDDDYLPPDWYKQYDGESDVMWTMPIGFVDEYIRSFSPMDVIKSNPSSWLIRRTFLERVFEEIPEDIRPLREPFLYLLVTHHLFNPTYQSATRGVFRGVSKPTDWNTLEEWKDSDIECWCRFLDCGKPIVKSPRIQWYFDEYFRNLRPE